MVLNPRRIPISPNFSVQPLTAERFHPIPVDFGEVRKLSEIEQTRVATHFECVRKAPCVPAFVRRPGNSDASSAHALRVTPSPGIHQELVTARVLDLLTYPDWELLSPAVVVRRRPKRM